MTLKNLEAQYIGAIEDNRTRSGQKYKSIALGRERDDEKICHIILDLSEAHIAVVDGPVALCPRWNETLNNLFR